MPMTIIVPVALAEAEKARPMIEIAQKLGGADAEIVLVTVIEDVPGYIAAELPQGLMEETAEEARSQLREIGRKAGMEAPVEVRKGHAATGILAVADRVEASADAEIERHFPEHFGTAVDMTFADGTTRSATVLDSIGTPARPMSIEDVKAKASGLIAAVDREFDVDRLHDAVVGLGRDGRGPVEDLVMTDKRNPD